MSCGLDGRNLVRDRLSRRDNPLISVEKPIESKHLRRLHSPYPLAVNARYHLLIRIGFLKGLNNWCRHRNCAALLSHLNCATD